jgi:hypothetical protein
MIFLYGVHGVGKTSFAAAAPAPIFILAEDPGFDKLGLSVDHFPVAKSWAEIINNLKMVLAEGAAYKTVVIDTIDAAFSLAEKHLIETEPSFNKSRADYDNYGKGYKFLAAEIRDNFLRLCNQIRDNGKTIVLLAFQNPEGKDWDRYQPKLPDGGKTSINRLICEAADMVLFANYVTIVKDGKGQASNRVLYTTNSAAFEAKQRHGIPSMIEFSWDFLQKLIASAKKAREQKTIAVALPTAPATIPATPTAQIDLKSLLAEDLSAATAWLVEQMWLAKGADIETISEANKKMIMDNSVRFIKTIREFAAKTTEKAAV